MLFFCLFVDFVVFFCFLFLFSAVFVVEVKVRIKETTLLTT